MKKALLFLIACTVVMSMYSQRVWNMGDDLVNFPLSAGIGAGPDRSVFVNDLGIHTGAATATNMAAITLSAKTFGSYTWANRLQLNGGGYTGSSADHAAPTVNMPTQRFLTVNVTGSGSIIVHGLTGSSASNRRLFITDGVNLIGNMPFPAGTEVTEQIATYTGGPAILYIFGNAAINLYRLEVTSATTHLNLGTGVSAVLTQKGVSFNGSQVLNPNGLNLEIFYICWVNGLL